HEQEEALVAAKAFLEGEGMPEEVLEELQARWASLHIAPPAEEAAAEPAAAAEATGVSAAPEEAEEAALGSHEAVLEEVEVVQVEVKKTKGAPRMWFGWKAEAPTGSWQQSAQGQKMKKVREALPAFKVKDELSKLLASDQVVLVHGETGSGKTTQIGQFLVEAAGGARVVVTQPRRFAALSVARRVAEERGEELGQNAVGYMVRGETKMHPARCQLLFCTLGVLLRRLIAQGSEEMFSSNDMTHLVLDEVHERSMDMDFVLTLLRHALPSRPKLK
ncbi:DExH-box ATP-dependent RNA helicase DExH3, partial [Durusdinium trenchii]